jgi:hypothetical protein
MCSRNVGPGTRIRNSLTLNSSVTQGTLSDGDGLGSKSHRSRVGSVRRCDSAARAAPAPLQRRPCHCTGGATRWRLRMASRLNAFIVVLSHTTAATCSSVSTSAASSYT